MPADFLDFVTSLDSGQVFNQLNDELERVVDAVDEYDGRGELTLKITLKKEGNRIVAATKLDAKAPREPVADTLFFADGKGGLCREDPRQLVLRKLDNKRVRNIEEEQGDE